MEKGRRWKRGEEGKGEKWRREGEAELYLTIRNANSWKKAVTKQPKLFHCSRCMIGLEEKGLLTASPRCSIEMTDTKNPVIMLGQSLDGLSYGSHL